MSGDSKRRLELREAARIIYRTVDPTPQQVEAVRRELARGHLHGDRDGRWTTAAAVAAYLADRSYGHHDTGRGRAAAASGFVTVGRVVSDAGARRPGVVRSNDTLVTLYREFLQDYFLAVLRRRKQHDRSKLFARAVVAGQVICLLVLLGVFVLGVHGIQALRKPPEHAAIEHWIADTTGDFAVLRWDPTGLSEEGDGVLVRVEYQYYSPSRKRIVTQRTFEVRGDEVTPLALDEGSEP